jgi:chitinase
MIGYYASWQWYDRNGLAAPSAFDFEKVTRANFAFFQINDRGDIWGTDNWADPITLFGPFDWTADESASHSYCSWDEPGAAPSCMTHHYTEGLIYLAHAAGAEVYPSIGGWSLSDPFPTMAADAEARANFASQCIELIKNYNFDGIDIDWEYPGYEPHSGTPEDTVSFNLLLDDLRAALDAHGAETGRYYGLTAALPCGPSIIDNQDIAHVGSVLTELNLMTYDFHGSWNEKTGVNAPLYDQDDSPEFSVHGCVENWIEGGAPMEKMNIGFPFYGRSFLSAEHLYQPHDGNDDTTWHADEGVPQYYNIMDKMDEMTSVRDDQTMTQYCYGNTGVVSYDDPRAICDKTHYAQERGLNGYIIWELSGDLMPDLSTPLLDAANAKLLDPGLDCASMDLSDHVAQVVGEAFSQGHGEEGDGAPAAVYYPDFGSGVCLNDGMQSDWIQKSDTFDNLGECCDKHFSWNEDCREDSPDSLADPSAVDLVGQSPGELGTSDEIVPLDLLYYPSQTGVECLNDGKQPMWLSEDIMFETLEVS